MAWWLVSDLQIFVLGGGTARLVDGFMAGDASRGVVGIVVALLLVGLLEVPRRFTVKRRA